MTTVCFADHNLSHPAVYVRHRPSRRGSPGVAVTHGDHNGIRSQLPCLSCGPDRHARTAQKRTNMTNTEANSDKAAAAAAHGAHVAPKKASSNKGTTTKKGAPKDQRAPRVAKPKPP